jgi:hypothetical protein
MGILTDIFIASAAEATHLEARRSPLSKYVGADIKSIGLVEMACLQCIFNRENPSDADHVMCLIESFSLVQEVSEEGPWVYQVPDMLTEALAKASQIELDQIRTQWYKTEEMKDHARRYLQDEHHDPLQILAHLAAQAKQVKKSLFLWFCL